MHDELNLFLNEMADVKPLKADELQPDIHRNQLDGNLEQRRAQAQESEYLAKLTTDIGMIKPVEPDAIFTYQEQGVQGAVFRNLKNGHYKFETQLDVHGYKVKQARAAVIDYILNMSELGQRCAYIIHGKGYKSQPFPGVLKSFVCHWLSEMEEVLAVHSALRQHGGTGAVYVMLAKSAQSKIDTREQNHKGVGFR